MIVPGKAYRATGQMIIEDVEAPADSMVAVLYRNGAVDGAVVVTCTHISNGKYWYTWTMPGGYAESDSVSVLATATVGVDTFNKWVFNSDDGSAEDVTDLATAAKLSEVAGHIDTLDAALSVMSDYIVTLLARIPATLFAGITSLAGWLRLMIRSDAGIATDEATSLSEINSNEGSGAGDYDNTLSSLEAGGSDCPSIEDIQALIDAASADIQASIEASCLTPCPAEVQMLAQTETMEMEICCDPEAN